MVIPDTETHMEKRQQNEASTLGLDVHAILESHEPNKTGRIALGFEVGGTLSVTRGPAVPEFIRKSPCEAQGSLKPWPGRHLRLASCNSKPKAYFTLNG